MRVIAGTLKGRQLKAPAWPGLRPTSDKLRETLFNVLAARVPGARLLDGYAGTGAVGIEALSRGAAQVTFVGPAAKLSFTAQPPSTVGTGSTKVADSALIGRTDRIVAADRAHPTTDRTMNS